MEIKCEKCGTKLFNVEGEDNIITPTENLIHEKISLEVLQEASEIFQKYPNGQTWSQDVNNYVYVCPGCHPEEYK